MSAASTDDQDVIRTLEAKATDFERRAAKLRAMAAEYRDVAGLTPPAPLAPGVSAAVAPRVAAEDNKGPSLSQASYRILGAAGAPLHVTEIAAQLRAQGVHLPDDKEKTRLTLVRAFTRRKDLFRPVGAGRYAAISDGAPAHPRPSPSTNGHGGRAPVPTTTLVVDLLTRGSGPTTAEAAAQLAPSVESPAQNPRKLVHSTIHYLIQKGRVRKEADGRLYLSDQGAPLDGAPENDNGLEPELALDR